MRLPPSPSGSSRPMEDRNEGGVWVWSALETVVANVIFYGILPLKRTAGVMGCMLAWNSSLFLRLEKRRERDVIIPWDLCFTNWSP